MEVLKESGFNEQASELQLFAMPQAHMKSAYV